MRILKVKKIVPHAILPLYATHGSAGFDLSAIEHDVILPGEWSVVRTGLSFDIPKGYEIQIRPRSGLAAKKGITVLNSPGTIDSDYIDEVKIILFNCGKEPFGIGPSDRIAQGVFAPIEQAELIEIYEIDQFAALKDRGGGFGSTGK